MLKEHLLSQKVEIEKKNITVLVYKHKVYLYPQKQTKRKSLNFHSLFKVTDLSIHA